MAPPRDRFHVPPADLTAFAHGELPEWHRAEVSRHVLGCAACRETLEASRDVLGLLRDAGRLGIESLRAEVAARRPAFASRALTATARAASVAAVVALGVLLAPPRGPGGSASAPITMTTTAAAAEPALTPEQRALVGAQREDGRWAAETAFGGARRDEAATSLALLALLPADADGLRAGPAARAVAAGLRWLRVHVAAAGEDRAIGEDDAIAACALLDVFARSGDAALRAVVDRAVRRIAMAYPESLEGIAVTPALGWSLRALTRASSLGWRHVDGAIARIRAADATVDGSLRALAGVVALPVAADAPCALALRVLRDRARS